MTPAEMMAELMAARRETAHAMEIMARAPGVALRAPVGLAIAAAMARCVEVSTASIEANGGTFSLIGPWGRQGTYRR